MKKTLSLMLAFVLVICASVAGTMAYLTSSDTVVNTFTVGEVKLKLDETDVDNSTPGQARDKANSYALKPGAVHTKDPIVTVLEGSEDCYVRVFVKINKHNELKAISEQHEKFKMFGGFFGGSGEGWGTPTMTTKGNVDIYELRYNTMVTEPKALDAVFETLTVPEWFTPADIQSLMDDPNTPQDESMTITITAEAIQSAGFANADEAFAALDQQKTQAGA